MLLEVREIAVHYRKIAAVREVSLGVDEGRIVTLIGNNGAGKTTTLRAVTGWVQPTRGEIRFDGTRIDGLRADRINRMGVAHVPEGRRVFPQMTVLENLEMGAYLRHDRTAVRRDLETVYVHFPILLERRRQLAGTLSGGQQQMLAMGRALMSNPRLIVMDEPSLGLSPVMCQQIARIIRDIHAEGRTIVLVEQNARLALSLADHAYVLDTGTVILEGPAAALREDEGVRRAYLGG
jgi:branched-chain amino acid transport system ATP-binding protein